MTELPLIDPIQMTWTRSKRAGSCGRDPSAGPGTCRYWWDTCIDSPDAEKRGCFALWAQKHHRLGHVPGIVTASTVTAVTPMAETSIEVS